MPKMHQNRKKEIDRGFIALEVLGVLVIMALLALWGAEKYSEFLEERSTLRVSGAAKLLRGCSMI
ncbi:hypothetical protein [Arsenophonus sp.]|uniref:hypothetical protein n=1 Tax=Arsenophonus sp. TaxID=1872640 RepID=UPI0028558ADD|nr:hypothetical protein [Arsenophonus sp.]MDR5617837.1 hypothetical protein [Arsenophonus sp.]